MIAKSPSFNPPELNGMLALNPGSIANVDPSFSAIAVGLNIPVKVASMGKGLAPPMAMVLPSKDKPSAARVKYDGPKTTLGPLVKSTVKLRLERLTAVETGQVESGKSDEFGPV
jgi:hypothetical protein